MLTAEIFFYGVWYPWLKWPPWGKSKDKILSWGFKSPVYTSKLAGDPDNDCTLTPHYWSFNLKAFNALFWHKTSMSSTNSVPP